MQPRVLHWSPKDPTNATTKNKKLTKLKQTHQQVTQGAKKTKKHIDTNSQPSNRDTKKQTIEQTHKQELRTANTNTNSRGRVLAEGDVDPAALSSRERQGRFLNVRTKELLATLNI